MGIQLSSEHMEHEDDKLLEQFGSYRSHAASVLLGDSCEVECIPMTFFHFEIYLLYLLSW